MSLVVTSALQKYFPDLHPDLSRVEWVSFLTDFIVQKQKETKGLVLRLNENIVILEHQKEKASILVSILEEAGGLTVRARKLMTTPEDIQKYEQKIKDFQDLFQLTLLKFDKTSIESGTSGVNLMNGDRLETLFDTKGQNKLVTEGIVLSSQSLGIRPPNFSTSYTLQNARIDVMNAIDIVITVRNTITAHIANLTINREFALQSVDFAETAHQKIGSSDQEAEVLSLKKLGMLGDKILGDEKLANPIQEEILTSFASSPNMEDI